MPSHGSDTNSKYILYNNKNPHMSKSSSRQVPGKVRVLAAASC